MSGDPQDVPLASSASPPPDPLDATPELRLRADLAGLLLAGFLGFDAEGALVLRGRRDGEGLRAILMNYVIEDALGRPYFRIRQPSSGIHLNLPFQLLAPDDRPIGELRLSMNRASLQIPGQLPLTAALPFAAWHGYSVEQGSVTLASITFVGHPLWGGAELHLRFEPLGASPPLRHWVVALVAGATLIDPPWKAWTTR